MQIKKDQYHFASDQKGVADVKKQRRLAIREIIAVRRIGSQGQLLDELRDRGYSVTQATLSRDLKRMRVGKTTHDGRRSYYALPISARGRSKVQSDGAVNGFLSYSFSGNLGAVKTLAGFAGGVASQIDSLGDSRILGTVAGDDTIFVLFKEGIEQKNMVDFFNSLIKEGDS